MRVFEIEVIVGTVDVPRNADNVFPAIERLRCSRFGRWIPWVRRH
jgi:hypothetical protein